MTTYQLIIADDHPVYLDALAMGISQALTDTQIEKTSDYLRLFDMLEQHADSTDLLLMDLSMPGTSGLAGLYFIRSQFPELPILVISAHDEFNVKQQCLSAGASVFLSKNTQLADIISAIQQLLQGQFTFASKNPLQLTDYQKKLSSLTRNQYKALHLLAAGLSNKEIAQQMAITEKTVKAHVSAVLQKLDVSNRTKAAQFLGVNKDQLNL